MSFNGAHVFYTAMLCMFVLCYGVYIKKPTFLKPDGISCTLGERDIYDIYADTVINSGLWLSKVRKNVFRDSQSKTKLLLLLLLICGDIELHPGPTNTNIEKLHIEELSNLLKHRGIKIFHQNVRGLLTNIDKVKVLFCDFKNIDILTLSETHINDDTYNDNAKLYEVPGFKFVHRNRINGTHGGVAMYVSNKIQFHRRKDLEQNMLECIWIKIYVRQSQNYLIGTIYRPPDGTNYLPTCFNNSLHNMVSNVITKSREVTLL